VPIFEGRMLCRSDLKGDVAAGHPCLIRRTCLHCRSRSQNPCHPPMRLAYFCGAWEVLSACWLPKTDGGTGPWDSSCGGLFQNHYEEHMDRVAGQYAPPVNADDAAA